MKTWEMIKKLTENPEKKFVSGKETSGERTAYVNGFNCIVQQDAHGLALTSIDIRREWEEIKEPLSFIEVLEVVKENYNTLIDFVNEDYGISYEGCFLGDILSALVNDFCSDEMADILLNSKFYISN